MLNVSITRICYQSTKHKFNTYSVKFIIIKLISFYSNRSNSETKLLSIILIPSYLYFSHDLEFDFIYIAK